MTDEIWKVTASALQARSLIANDTATNAINPYLILNVGVDKKFETGIQEKNVNPSWPESFDFDFKLQDKSFLIIECYDSLAYRNLATKIKKSLATETVHDKADIFLGIVKINLLSLVERANDYDRNSFKVKEWYPFGKMKTTDKVTGDLQVQLLFEKKNGGATPNSPSGSGNKGGATEEGEDSTIGYCGNISRVEAEQRLLGKPVGTFLMRFSESASCYVLSYVRPDHKIGHIAHIKQLEGKVEVVTERGTEQFLSLHDFIQTMKKNRVIFEPVEHHQYGKTK